MSLEGSGRINSLSFCERCKSHNQPHRTYLQIRLFVCNYTNTLMGSNQSNCLLVANYHKRQSRYGYLEKMAKFPTFLRRVRVDEWQLAFQIAGAKRPRKQPSVSSSADCEGLLIMLIIIKGEWISDPPSSLVKLDKPHKAEDSECTCRL